MPEQLDHELAVIESVADAPPLKKFATYAKLSGPGWLQGAITLGGGSLAGALFLGVISGYGLLWVQPLAMICGIIMLSAIAFVTLSTQTRPFHAINHNISPLLGWSWLIATIMANLVWTMPQFALATAAIQQNLMGGANFSPIYITLPLFALAIFVNYLYQSGGNGAKAFDRIIKVMVGIIVLSFFAVVFALLSAGELPLGEIFAGFVPNFSLLNTPAPIYLDFIAQSNFPEYWNETIANSQRDVIIAAFGTAVGINMTFLLPYSLLKKKWGPKHRGLSITDLSIGLFVPFFLATTCVVIAAASSFNGKSDISDADALAMALTYNADAEAAAAGSGKVAPAFVSKLDGELTGADFQLADMLTKRDAGALAVTLEPFAGKFISQKIFGIGVLGMALSTIIILMLMNGLAFQEAFSTPPSRDVMAPSGADEINDSKPLYFLGCSLSGISGLCFPLLWAGQSKAALAVPTSVIGGSLIPIAYFTFFLMMNSRKILGDKMPKGAARIRWNILMIFATSVATLGSVWVLRGKSEAPGWIGSFATGGLVFLGILFVVGVASFFYHENKAKKS